ncbi:MAG: O-Antigen ligase [Acidobacteria bacterium]|nr:O-Antigen ligase [Acidobacteriota bacterium]
MNVSALSPSALGSVTRASFIARRVGQSNALGNLTGSGISLFILCLLLTASAVKPLRVPVGGLLVHPYIFLLVPLLLFVGPRRIAQFPRRALFALIGFEFFYILSVATGFFSIDDILKIGASGVTIISTALLVRTRADFRAAVLALSIATTVLSIYNIMSGGEMFGIGGGVDVSRVIANKNAFSLYILPSLFLSLNLVLDRTAPKALRIILAASTVVMTVAIFSSANRSGWLGAIFIGLMTYGRGRGRRSGILMSVIVFSTYYAVVHYTGSGEVERRVTQTEEGYSGDMVRLDVASQSLSIGLENPVLGVSPSGLSRELGRRLPREAAVIHSLGDARVLGPHNAILQIIGGSGFIAFSCLGYFAWQLWKRPRFGRPLSRALIGQMHSGHILLRMIVVLWVLRGMFTDEVLYSPSFCIGLGLCIGLCMIEGCWAITRRHDCFAPRI